MTLSEFNLNLIPQVGATGGDAVLQPTFGTLAGVSNPGTTASITLTASSTSVAVGGQVKVDVEIKTGSFTINEYRLVIDFDPTKLQVVDAEPNTPGTQITHSDNVFQVASGSNSTSASGRITLIAKTPSGNALQVNRKVATVTFQAQNLGATNVQTATGATGSQLINQNGVAIANTVNNLTLNVGNTAPTSITSVTRTSTARPTTLTTTGTSPVSPLPDTALGDDLVGLLAVLAGVGLLSVGITLIRSTREFRRK